MGAATTTNQATFVFTPAQVKVLAPVPVTITFGSAVRVCERLIVTRNLSGLSHTTLPLKRTLVDVCRRPIQRLPGPSVLATPSP